jgi:hypothetical protein
VDRSGRAYRSRVPLQHRVPEALDRPVPVRLHLRCLGSWNRQSLPYFFPPLAQHLTQPLNLFNLFSTHSDGSPRTMGLSLRCRGLHLRVLPCFPIRTQTSLHCWYLLYLLFIYIITLHEFQSIDLHAFFLHRKYSSMSLSSKDQSDFLLDS